ncbi:hypothetical protein Ancab_032111 [Ancistrocladus abbreviatus]
MAKFLLTEKVKLEESTIQFDRQSRDFFGITVQEKERWRFRFELIFGDSVLILESELLFFCASATIDLRVGRNRRHRVAADDEEEELKDCNKELRDFGGERERMDVGEEFFPAKKTKIFSGEFWGRVVREEGG